MAKNDKPAAKSAAVKKASKKDMAQLVASEERAFAAAQIGSQLERVAHFNALSALAHEMRSRAAAKAPAPDGAAASSGEQQAQP